jgi:hypothetical protein
VVVRHKPTCIVDNLRWKANLATFDLTYDPFRDMTQSILALNLVIIGK